MTGGVPVQAKSPAVTVLRGAARHLLHVPCGDGHASRCKCPPGGGPTGDEGGPRNLFKGASSGHKAQYLRFSGRASPIAQGTTEDEPVRGPAGGDEEQVAFLVGGPCS